MVWNKTGMTNGTLALSHIHLNSTIITAHSGELIIQLRLRKLSGTHPRNQWGRRSSAWAERNHLLIWPAIQMRHWLRLPANGFSHHRECTSSVFWTVMPVTRRPKQFRYARTRDKVHDWRSFFRTAKKEMFQKCPKHTARHVNCEHVMCVFNPFLGFVQSHRKGKIAVETTSARNSY